MEKAVLSLAEFPRRCPLAPERAEIGLEVRQRIYGVYRLLFTLVDADDGDADTVRILHVRHGAQQRSPLNQSGDKAE